MYVAIDGDDFGRLIVASYLSNDEEKLSRASKDLANSAQRISELLQAAGFTVIFCAADGVAAKGPDLPELESLFEKVRGLAPEGLTFSAGVGNDLHEAYVALLNAKCTGKDRYERYSQISQ